MQVSTVPRGKDPRFANLGHPSHRRGVDAGTGIASASGFVLAGTPAAASVRGASTEGGALIVARTAGGHLYLEDQHRAHERIIYESLNRGTPPATLTSECTESDTSAGQLLLVPVLVELSPIQARLLLARLDELAGMGLEVQHFGGSVFLVRSLPPLPAGPSDPSKVAREVARAAAEDADEWLDHVRVSLACRSAIRRGQTLSISEQKALLDGFREVRTSAVCPHGSPLILRYSKRFLARAFEW